MGVRNITPQRSPMTSSPAPVPISAPSLLLLGIEPLRGALEYASMRLMNRGSLPSGDGHPVVIFPGLAADKRSTGPLKSFCEGLGYAAHDWGRGFNTGPRGDIDAWLTDLAQHVHELTAEYDQTVSLIGWSLGGIYAREIAKVMRRRVRQVITIGTPFAGSAQHTHASWVYRLLNGQKPGLDDALASRLQTAPDVPTTAIYSRSDGVVAWQACIQAGNCKHVDNIEIEGSHVGMGWNPRVLSIIARKLGNSR